MSEAHVTSGPGSGAYPSRRDASSSAPTSTRSHSRTSPSGRSTTCGTSTAPVRRPMSRAPASPQLTTTSPSSSPRAYARPTPVCTTRARGHARRTSRASSRVAATIVGEIATGSVEIAIVPVPRDRARERIADVARPVPQLAHRLRAVHVHALAGHAHAFERHRGARLLRRSTAKLIEPRNAEEQRVRHVKGRRVAARHLGELRPHVVEREVFAADEIPLTRSTAGERGHVRAPDILDRDEVEPAGWRRHAHHPAREVEHHLAGGCRL